MIRKTLRWLLILLLLAGVAGGATVWYAWVQGDEYAKEELLVRLAEIAPQCEVQVGRVRFDWDQSVHLRDFAARPKGQDISPPFVVPEAVLRIDRERFLNEQVVDVQAIRLIRPRLDVTRRLDGTWTIHDLMPFHLDPSIAVPEWQIEQATLRFRLEQPDGEPVVLTLQDADLRLVPSGRRQLIIRGLSDVADAGPLRVSGHVDLDRGTWSLNGSVSGLNTSGNIAGFALRTSAGLREQVAVLGQKLREAEESLLSDGVPGAVANAPFRTASQVRQSPRGASPEAAPIANAERSIVAHDGPCDLTGLGINAMLDLRFALNRTDADRPPSYQAWVECRDGQVVNPLLPFALRHLRGSLYWDNANLKLTSLQADGGGTVLKVQGGFRLNGPAPVGTIAVSVTDLAVSDRYPGRLPPAIERFLETVRPSGPVDLSGQFDRTADGQWVVQQFELTAKGATATPEPFPYPIREIVGTLKQTEPGLLVAEMNGKAGTRPIHLKAVIVDPGPEAEVAVEVTAEGIALDETFREACPPEAREVLKEIELRGTAGFELSLYRPAGLDCQYEFRFGARLSDGEIEFQQFPYRLSKISGEISFDSERETLQFWNVVGHHDRAVISGAGSYRDPPEPGEDGISLLEDIPFGLHLELAARQLNLGSDLRAALPAPLKHLWEELQPGGIVEARAKVAWVPGGEPHIELTQFDVTNGSLRLRSFPYTLETIAAKLTYVPATIDIVDGHPIEKPAIVTVKEFDGWHPDGALIRIRNGTLELESDSRWSLRLVDFRADSLRLGSEFRRAAPEGLRQAVESLNLRGPLNIAGRIDVRGLADIGGPVTAGWNLIATLKDVSVNPGLQISRAYGQIQCGGTYDGQTIAADGNVNLDQADVLGQRLTRVKGPFQIREGRIRLGSADALKHGPNAATEPDVPIEQRFRSEDYLGGLLTLDALISLDEGPRYVGRATLTGGSLERYAQANASGSMRNLAGVMNGYVNFWGQGTTPSGVEGRGQLSISPAALYELPVIMKILTSLASPDNTAFRRAQLNFTIHNSALHFDHRDRFAAGNRGSIVLDGDALRLVGGGRIGFDGRIGLDLYTTVPRNPARRLPLVGGLVGGVVEAVTTGWMGVEVRGTTDAPFVQTVPLKALNDEWRQMLDSDPPPGPPRAAILPSRWR